MVNLGKTEAREVFHQVVQQAGFSEPAGRNQKHAVQVFDFALQFANFLRSIGKIVAGDDATVSERVAHECLQKSSSSTFRFLRYVINVSFFLNVK